MLTRKKTCSPGPAQIPVPISRRMSYNTYTYRVLGWPRPASSMQRARAALPHRTTKYRGRSRSRSNPTFLSVCLAVVPHTSLGPRRHRITQHSTALRCTAEPTTHCAPSSRPRTLLSTLSCTLPSALGLPFSIYLLPYLARSPWSSVPSPQYTNTPPNLTQPISHISYPNHPARPFVSTEQVGDVCEARCAMRCDVTIKPDDSAQI
jgi:hypothetical protein